MKENIYFKNYNNNYLENHVRIKQNELNSQEIIINKLKKDILSYQRDVLKSFNDLLIKFYEKEKDKLNCKDEFANLINNNNICIENINIEIGFFNRIREQLEIKDKDYKNGNNLKKQLKI